MILGPERRWKSRTAFQGLSQKSFLDPFFPFTGVRTKTLEEFTRRPICESQTLKLHRSNHRSSIDGIIGARSIKSSKLDRSNHRNGEDEDNDDGRPVGYNQEDKTVPPPSPEMGNKSAKRGTDMRPIMGYTPAAETAKKTQSRIVEAEDVTSIASFVDETSGKVKRRRCERRHRSKTDELQSNFFIL